MDKQQPNYYGLIPAKIRYDNSLSNSQKLFFSEITALTQKEGYCWASNSYFADLYDVDTSTVSRWVTGLKKQGYISVKYDKEGKQIKKRKIKPLMDLHGNELMQGVLNKDQGGIESMQGGYCKNGKGNNTRINNTSNNNKSVSTNGTDFPSTCEYLDEAKELSQYLLDSIIEYDPTHKYANNPPSTDRWVLDIERAMRLDGRTKEQLEFIIDYIYKANGKHSDFWAGNVESGKKLRKHFDKIKSQIRQESQNGKQQKQRNIATEAAKL